MRKASLVAAGIGLLFTLIAATGFLVRAGRFRLPALSAPGLAIVALSICWIAWRARRGSGWARRTEAGILAIWGAYLVLAPTLFDGWREVFTRCAGSALTCLGFLLLARLVRDEMRKASS